MRLEFWGRGRGLVVVVSVFWGRKGSEEGEGRNKRGGWGRRGGKVWNFRGGGDLGANKYHTRDFLFGVFDKVVCLSKIWSAATVPEEEPLQGLADLELVSEAKYLVYVVESMKI